MSKECSKTVSIVGPYEGDKLRRRRWTWPEAWRGRHRANTQGSVDRWHCAWAALPVDYVKAEGGKRARTAQEGGLQIALP